MKPKIHPQYFPDAIVTCSSCRNTFTTGSTKQSISVEVCHKCHPFFTGEHRYLDIKGRVDTFQKKQEIAKKFQATISTKKRKITQKEDREPKSLKELLSEI
ncbi:50S ribosomal protein L31 [Candidatus Roizmanbacteria bacterium RIFCSPHIGHO2_02_FULL_37_15]|uniref:50S ribosomal protein L31 n=1 Tax=Candidatus Roizmanbacteria bacterium RIFCSPLOWO2_01_FULL_37_16 TaxID=1802058 RepID=A0A1F7IQF9_9BACT|nr:MAG: 50S ribosomal protein L31 [Candidatus Roizmanbacteria bacterium RIFCSPHIGHO2_01_FULL_37_16b]OGK21120.1 MAG: 50S ribosomal protein L31 [Candidatus Roizmanbacteria bacterium RIFCSPHIGHO2_02_FULL_37_15]OGK31478.1 MAG: 50S ribosomal protein L31 [Candidatus Roizmanbacteria bacterium RIFCSPHIGHO2_12_FULL_36_11]OGK45598.1 MAG: 50S ribosomal protein L31 [Candidatus Roizmanbacteria bacterium RIFCSPLOWO2_01_FULL_37_16]OGK55995.1 MAG: 50S ribosomal protein L31 [Candidatus Roizmanbacteria bacterium